MRFDGVRFTVYSTRNTRAFRQNRIEALAEGSDGSLWVGTVDGFLPICAWCKKARDDAGYWKQIEAYVRDHTDTEFTHGICPDCEKTFHQEHGTS